MKLLILGGKGMAGHVMVDYFKQFSDYVVSYTSRDQNDSESIYLDLPDAHRVEEIIDLNKPDIVINCIGILNDRATNNPLLAFQVNSLLPNQLAKLMERHQGKLIHLSTDCVFSGERGDYTESDIADGSSVYAQSKQLGEVLSDKHLTIRTSIIGPELKDDGIGLFLWFMKQTGDIKGYEKVLWNGVTTLELTKATKAMIEGEVAGLYHLGAEKKVSKYALLTLIKDIFGKNDVSIHPDEAIVLDRTIKSIRTDFHYPLPSYEKMIKEMKDWLEKH